MEQWSYTSTHPLGHTGPVTGSLYLYLTPVRIDESHRKKAAWINGLWDKI
jgi:hypothetical protein